MNESLVPEINAVLAEIRALGDNPDPAVLADVMARKRALVERIEGCRALGPEPLEAIVRELADRGAPPSFDEETCWYCDTVIVYTEVTADKHEATCAWRKAVEWVAAHPVEATDG